MGYKITSQESLKNLAVFYCSKRETSRSWLQKYLQRKCKEQKIEPATYRSWIEFVLDHCEEKNILNDKRYADIIVREYTRRGKGTRYVQNKLREKGIAKSDQNIPNDQDAELERATKLAAKIMDSLSAKVSRKIERKPKQPFSHKIQLTQKMIQKLISSGFSLEISRQAILQVLNTYNN